ncbi:hypothetical protein BC828DRAFT_372339 [Blastocladiella britannica]|nr:hypothetical protein BC828DRAFT_372339 [Blastocladiella britannica]
MSRLMLDGSPNPFRNDEYDPFAAVSGSPPAPAGLEDTLTDPAPLQGVLALKATDLAVPPNSTKSFSPSDRKQSVYSLETALRRKSMFAAPDANIPGTVTATATIPINSEGVPSLAKETKVKNSAPPSPAPVTPVTGSVAPMAAAPVPSSATRRASGARRPSGMMFHPGIPSIAKAGSMVQATAGTAVTRQASVVVRDGVIMLQGLAGVQEDAEAPGDLQPSQGGNPIKSLIRRMSRRLSVISGAKEGGGGVGAPLAPSAARRISRPVVGLGLTMEEEESSNDTFHSTSEFPEGYLLGFSECREVLEPIELSVEGHIPSWLSGVFYRYGHFSSSSRTFTDLKHFVVAALGNSRSKLSCCLRMAKTRLLRSITGLTDSVSCIGSRCGMAACGTAIASRPRRRNRS